MQNCAVFLDRDGVLIEDVHYLSSLDQIKLFPDVPEGLRQLRTLGVKLIVVTNQSGIARGYFSESFVHESHACLSESLAKFGVTIDDFYFCPHHRDGHPPLNIECDCRKPATGMLLQAAKDHDIDLEKSFVIGDKTSDVELAYRSGAKGILVKTGKGVSESETVAERFPSAPILETFHDAVHLISQSLMKS